MENLHRVIDAYKSMDQDCRRTTVAYLEALAAQYPRREPLRLVANNLHANNFRHIPGVDEHHLPALFVCAPEKSE